MAEESQLEEEEEEDGDTHSTSKARAARSWAGRLRRAQPVQVAGIPFGGHHRAISRAASKAEAERVVAEESLIRGCIGSVAAPINIHIVSTMISNLYLKLCVHLRS